MRGEEPELREISGGSKGREPGKFKRDLGGE